MKRKVDVKSAVRSALVLLALGGFSATASASHIFVTDPSINGTPLDSFAGFTNPAIAATVGGSLDVTAGFYDYCGGTCTETWTMHFSQTGGSLTLTDLSLFVVPGSSATPSYYMFSQLLSTVGTWTGFLEPFQGDSCPSYRYGNGVEGGGGCGGPSESIPFSLSVTAAVPEPETYAMMLAGLGLLGFVARRRQRKLAAA